VDSGARVKKNPDMAARAALLSRIIKMAGDENDGPNFDYGDSPYTAMSEGKKMKTITDHKHKSPGAFFSDDHDINNIDFPTDEQIGPNQFGFNEETVTDPYYLGPEGPPGDMVTFPGATNL